VDDFVTITNGRERWEGPLAGGYEESGIFGRCRGVQATCLCNRGA